MASSLRSLFSLSFFFVGLTQALAVPLELVGPNLLDVKNSVKVELKKAKKATAVVFLSAKCPCSRSHEPVLTQLFKDFSAPDFEFVAIHSNSDENLAFTQPHFKEAKLPFPIIEDVGSKIANSLRAHKTPHVFLLSPKGEILFQGGIDNSHHAEAAKKHYLRNALTALKEGKEITEKEVRVLGCAIKRP